MLEQRSGLTFIVATALLVSCTNWHDPLPKSINVDKSFDCMWESQEIRMGAGLTICDPPHKTNLTREDYYPYWPNPSAASYQPVNLSRASWNVDYSVMTNRSQFQQNERGWEPVRWHATP